MQLILLPWTYLAGCTAIAELQHEESPPTWSEKASHFLRKEPEAKLGGQMSGTRDVTEHV